MTFSLLIRQLLILSALALALAASHSAAQTAHAEAPAPESKSSKKSLPDTKSADPSSKGQAELESKESKQVLVLLIYDQNCKVACTKVRPIMQELAQKYGEQIKYSELDASPEAFNASIKVASTLGVKTFLADSTDLAPIVGIFNARRKKVNELLGYKSKEVYQAAIERALSGH